jgi:3-keto-5-aminohexanoate cleavage enzyme
LDNVAKTHPVVAPLPLLMIAPNGARRTKTDHPALPITDDEIVETARQCWDAGADGIHLHIRDEQGRHLLDAARYRALLDRLSDDVPDMYLQVTSEAAGRYTATEQQAVMRNLQPDHVSVALREMMPGPDDAPQARDFYDWAYDSGVDIQHILYSPEDVLSFVAAVNGGVIPDQVHRVIFVQGRYPDGGHNPTPLAAYLNVLDPVQGMTFDWMVCAFGVSETDSLVEAAQRGGKMRIGFENSLWQGDRTRAKDNAERVRHLITALADGAVLAED